MAVVRIALSLVLGLGLVAACGGAETPATSSVYLRCGDAVFELESDDPVDAAAFGDCTPATASEAEPRMRAEATPAVRSAAATAGGEPWYYRNRRRAAERGPSESIGSADGGSLRGGARVGEGDGVRYVPSEVRAGGRFYGTVETVALVERLAAKMAARYPGTVLSIGELSDENGGAIPGHHSHQAGRDVDLAFYLIDEANEHAVADSLVQIADRGRARGDRGERYVFDLERNWALVEEILLDGTPIEFIFVAEWIEDWLLTHAERAGAPPSLIEHARSLIIEPEESEHGNHFHVRLYCEPEDRRCRDTLAFRPAYGHREVSARAIAEAAERAQRLGLGDERAAQIALRMAPPRSWTAVIGGPPPQTLLWPVPDGRMGRGFGMTREDQPDVPHNGIDVQAPPNSVVRAAADGLVVFAGEFRSFGNCIFLVHKNGWVTTYAHNSKNTVQPGELVARGEPIGLVGSSGISRGPHVHFEFRNRGTLEDPERLIARVRRWTDQRALPQRLVAEGGEQEAATPAEQPRLPVRIPRRIEEED